MKIASDVIAATADIALVLDDAGVIRDLSLGDGSKPNRPLQDWIGRAWVDTAMVDSKAKIETLLREARGSTFARSREINHRVVNGSAPLLFRYNAVRLGDQGKVLAIGRDLAELSNLQQQLVSAQQTMDREYLRVRQAETRYRLLFQVSSEGVLIADTASQKISECNPAACTILGETPQRLSGRALSTLFAPESWPLVQATLASVQGDGRAALVKAQLAASDSQVQVSASLFRQDNAPLFLLRVSQTDVRAPAPSGERSSRALSVLESMPDAFVVVDRDRRVLMANAAFLDVVQLPNENQVRGENLERWLGRPGVDLNILMANLREHGSVRNFATVMRGEYGASQEALVSAVSAMGAEPCLGFLIRPVASRLQLAQSSGPQLPRSVDQLRGLVGRVSLKEIVRESTDLIERLCIEAALEVSGDNRASAAQLLGLSRQSLYSKLRRHGMGDLDPGSGGL